MIVKKYYDFVYESKKYLGISQIVVTYYDNDIVEMKGYFNADNINDVNRILLSYSKKMHLIFKELIK